MSVDIAVQVHVQVQTELVLMRKTSLLDAERGRGCMAETLHRMSHHAMQLQCTPDLANTSSVRSSVFNTAPVRFPAPSCFNLSIPNLLTIE